MAFSSEQPHLPKEPLDESSLPFLLASNISVEAYNSFIESPESGGYKFEYNNGIIYIVEMCLNRHEAIIDMLRVFFHAPNNTYGYLDSPVEIRGQPLHKSPAEDGTCIAPDLAIFPNHAYVPHPPVPHPGPPPSDAEGCPYARIICEVAISQTYSKLKLKCRLWKLQSYVRSILGIKLYGVRATCNNPQGVRDREMKAILWRQGFPKQKWKFGTVNKDGSPTSCQGPNNPNYIVEIPVSDVFYDPVVPAIGYTPLPPPPTTLMAAVFRIDLYHIQQKVLRGFN